MDDLKSIKFKKVDNLKLVSAIGMYVNTLDEDKDYQLIIREYKPLKKRSLTANNYAWCLIDKLAMKLHEKKNDIYKTYIRDIGGNSNLLCIQERAVDDFEKVWNSNGIGWFVEKEPSKLKGCINVRAYYGSSRFDTIQMTRLIELIVRDCKENGIETMTPAELIALCMDWEEETRN